MSAKLPDAIVRHRRNGPCIDVALCGARGDGMVFVQRRKHTTCPGCIAKNAELVATRDTRVHRQLTARKAQLRGMPNNFRRTPQ